MIHRALKVDNVYLVAGTSLFGTSLVAAILLLLALLAGCAQQPAPEPPPKDNPYVRTIDRLRANRERSLEKRKVEAMEQQANAQRRMDMRMAIEQMNRGTYGTRRN